MVCIRSSCCTREAVLAEGLRIAKDAGLPAERGVHRMEMAVREIERLKEERDRLRDEVAEWRQRFDEACHHRSDAEYFSDEAAKERDEWQTQHENALASWRMDNKNLVARAEAAEHRAAKLEAQISEARAAAAILAHAYENDSRPPDTTVALAKSWSRSP